MPPHPGPGGPPHGGPGWGPPGGHGGGHGNPIVDCLCCPCFLVQYICYAFAEIGHCCGLGSCFGYDRRPPGHHPPPHSHYH